jgi:hypothetical protein
MAFWTVLAGSFHLLLEPVYTVLSTVIKYYYAWFFPRRFMVIRYAIAMGDPNQSTHSF